MARNSRDGYGFGLGGPTPALAPTPIISTRVPVVGDVGFEVGTTWINTATNQAWTMTSAAAGAASWILSSPGASDVDTINGLGPVLGDILIAGGTNVTDVNGGNTVTLNLDAAITLATSVTAPLYTAGAAADVAITAPAGQDVIITMGDNAAANNVTFNDLAGNPVFTVDSNGVLSNVLGITIVGALTQTAGIVNIGADAAANAVNIATGAAAKVVTIGSVTGAASLDLLAGTGNFTLEGDVATTYAISNTGVNTGQVDIAGGTGARAINIGGGGTGAKTIGIGAAASADVITIGDVTGAGSLALVCGTGNFTLEGNIATTYQISNVGINTGQVDIAGGTGARAINIGAGGTGAKTIGIGAAASADVITIGDATGAGSLDLVCGTGNFTLEGNIATTYAISNTGINTGQVDIAGGTGARTINVGGGGTGAKTINVGAAASADLITIGDATGAGSLDLLCGTGNFTLEGNIATTYQLSNVGVNTGQVDLAGGTGARTINIGGGGTGAKTINIGGAASADIITIGDATGAGSLALVCGTGNMTLNSTGAGDILIDSDDTLLLDSDGVLELNSSAGIIGIGSDADAFAINIGTGAAAREVTIGNNTGVSGITLTAGTGNIAVNGLFEDIQSKYITRTGDDIAFTQSPLTCTWANTGGVATGATGDVNLLSFQEGIIMEQFVLGAGQTIIKPVMTATGLLISGDETVTEGYEYNFGAARANSRHSFTIGTSPAFFLLWTFRADDISGLEPCYCGFRITQANQAVGNILLYTDFVGYGPNDGIAPGDAAIQTQLNTGGSVPTDTNDAWADGGTHELGILVDGAGVVTFTFDGGAPTATQAYTFDNGDVVHPFFRHEFNAALPDAIEWIDFQCGFQ